MTLSAALLTAAGAPAEGFTSKDALSTLLGVESFLFGALNIAIAASLPTQMGIRVLSSPRGFAIVVAALVTLVAAGAGIAWFDLYISGGWPHPWESRAIGGVILGAIVIQPALTIFIAFGVET